MIDHAPSSTAALLHDLLGRLLQYNDQQLAGLGLMDHARIRLIQQAVPMPLPVAEPAAPLTCPRCGTVARQVGEYVYRAWKGVEARGAAVEVEVDSDEFMVEAVAGPVRAWCDPCSEDFEFPEGMVLSWNDPSAQAPTPARSSQ